MSNKEKSKGFTNLIKSWFVEEDPAASQSPSEAKQPPVEESLPVVQETQPTNFSSNDVSMESDAIFDIEVSEKLTSFLEQNRDVNNQIGYLHFMAAYDKMPTVGMTEQSKFASVFATLSTVSLTKDALIESADYYISLLKTEHKYFLEGYEQKFQEKVKSLEQEIDTNSSTISEKIALIESLNAEIVEIESKNNELSAERDFNEKELLKMKNRFDFTVNVLKENMEANKEKINNFIQ
jgi:hypothetical protein